MVGLIAVVIGIDAIALAGLYLLLLLNAGVKQFFDPAHDSLIPEIASDEELAAANSFLSIASFGSTAIGFAGAGLLAGTVGLTWAFIIDAAVVPLRGGLHRADGPLPDAEARRRRERRGHRRQPEVRHRRPCSGRRSSARCSSSARSCSSRSACGTSCSCRSRSRSSDATEFQYGLQEGLTSVGFVVGSFFMARFSRLLPEPAWIVVALTGMGVGRRAVRPVHRGRGRDRARDDLRASSTRRPRSRAPCCSSATRRARCAAACSRRSTSCATSSSCSAWPAPGLADIVDIRLLIIFASSLLFVSAAFTLVAPGLGVSTWRAAAARLRASDGGARPRRRARSGPRRWPTSTASRGASARSRGSHRNGARRSCEGATVRQVPSGTRIVEHGDAASSAYFILDGSTTAGIPTEAGYRGLSTMTEGDFFGEIGALTGSPRTADVVADTDTTLLEVPADDAAIAR